MTGSGRRRRAQAIPFLKRFTVFNLAQCEGLPENLVAAAPPPEPGLIEPTVEALIKASGIDFRIGGSRAFYVPANDYVQVPPPQAYFEPINGTAPRCTSLVTRPARRTVSIAISPAPSAPGSMRSRSWWRR
jgi:antirestriction protein ArdC